jgi:L-2-hydroxyglutarate oxidase LhgO
MEDDDTQERHAVSSKFVFIGAGGGAIELLQKSRASPKAVAMAVSRSAESGSGVTIVQ